MLGLEVILCCAGSAGACAWLFPPTDLQSSLLGFEVGALVRTAGVPVGVGAPGTGFGDCDANAV